MQQPTPLFDTLQALKQTISDKQAQPQVLYPDDYNQVRTFLYSYRGSVATFNAYRRELERFLQWAWLVQKKSISTITRAEIEAFVEFCQNPPDSWIGLRQASRFIDNHGERQPNPHWRPFVANVSKQAYQAGIRPTIKSYSLSQKALQAIFSVLSSFYTYLVQEGYVSTNPVARIRQKSKFLRKQQQKSVVRRLTELQWSYVIETAEQLADNNPQQHERTLFIMSALYGMYLRISELTAMERWTPQMGDFYRDHDGNWWFITVGKGNKERHISVSDAMLKALRRYRTFLNLPPLPSPGETSPLLTKLRGKGPITSTRNIRLLVQQCFDKSIERLKADGFDEEALQLRAATVHWLRHTGISDDVISRPTEHVRDDAGHESSAITDKYIDVEARARHASKKKRKINSDI